MKRIALLTVLLLVVGLSLGFAQEFKPTFAWSTAGTASVTWGVNLDTMETGFQNAGSAQWTLTFVPAVTLSKGADAPVYGKIDLGVTATTVTDTGTFTWTATSVAATIQAKPFVIGVFSAPSLTLGGNFTVVDNTANYTDSIGILNKTETALATAVAGAGTYLQYVSDMITVKGSIVSLASTAVGATTVTDWTRLKDTEINYAAGVDATLVFKPVTLIFGAWDKFITGSTPIAYVGFSTTAIGPLTAAAELDLSLVATPLWDAYATVTLAFTPKTSLAVVAQYGDATTFNGLDTRAVFTTTEIANLTETLTAYALDVTSTTGMRLSIDNAITYKIALSDTTSVTPGFEVQYGQTAAAVNMCKLIGTVSASLIPNTTFLLTYTSGDVLATPLLLGTVTLAATVAY